MRELTASFSLDASALGYLTSSVQFGFIVGTLIFALLSIADRFSPSRVFAICAVLGALSNLGIIWDGHSYGSVLALRFLTGFFLAGIYPVGMKIAADYYRDGLGRSLGYLVGALVLGTALPHLLRDVKGELPWEFVIIITSCLACVGGLLMLGMVADGPNRVPSQKISLVAIPRIFKDREFFSAALGYFGHMWELYAFWAFVPIVLERYFDMNQDVPISTSLLSFWVIGVGAIACVIGGFLSESYGARKIAQGSLLASGICCIAAPLLFLVSSSVVFIAFMMIWGMVVIADSPLFSSLVAQSAPPDLKGTALTLVNCIGFGLTIVSIQTLEWLMECLDSPIALLLLALGPIIGLWVNRRRQPAQPLT